MLGIRRVISALTSPFRPDQPVEPLRDWNLNPFIHPLEASHGYAGHLLICRGGISSTCFRPGGRISSDIIIRACLEPSPRRPSVSWALAFPIQNSTSWGRCCAISFHARIWCATARMAPTQRWGPCGWRARLRDASISCIMDITVSTTGGWLGLHARAFPSRNAA